MWSSCSWWRGSSSPLAEARGEPPADPTHQLGLAVMGPKMLVMMVIGVAILATMISTVVLATHRGRYDRYGDDQRRRRPLDPGPGSGTAVQAAPEHHGGHASCGSGGPGEET
ncbi:NADH-quinone oxidoreductase subunit J [Nonomuraea thailandensis]